MGRWHLPLIGVLAEDEKRFGQLQLALSPVSPRALSQALKRAVALNQVRRRLEEDYPPVAIYSLAERARPLANAALDLH